MSSPRYPEIQVHVGSRNPLTLVAAVRYALWRADVERDEIDRFSEEALAHNGRRDPESVCREWVQIS